MNWHIIEAVFYDGQLVIMTEDHGEPALAMYRTVEGNHVRGHKNQRQIDVIQKEVLPALIANGFQNIGIITPYREQVKELRMQLGATFEIDTVHKFQGREKEAIILTSVDNVIGAFVDDPNMLNVAVSRAVKSLSVIVSDREENKKTNYGDLARYIEYNSFQIIESQVFSVFDLLYKGYWTKRKEYLKKHKRISEFDSENLAYSVIERVLEMPEFSQIGCVAHSSLSTLVKDYSKLTKEEAKYASNPLTHLDFLLFSKMDKAPILAIEIDGTSFHKAESKQGERDQKKNRIMQKCGVPLLRMRTDESNEEERIRTALKEIL